MHNPSAVASRPSQLHVDDFGVFESGIEPLGSLYSMALFTEIAEARFSEARRHGFLASLVTLDVDDFDGIRKRHGRLVADAAMLSVVELLRSALRREDMVALRGAATFEILLMHCDGPCAEMKAKSLCAAVALLDPKGVGLTASAGVAASVVGPGLRLDLLASRSADALQVARTRGGNCVVLGAAPQTPLAIASAPAH